jgi:hypothetical protein
MGYRRAGSIEAAARASLTAKPPAASDRAVAELALTIAQALDASRLCCEDCGALSKLPAADPKLAAQLLAALEALQMSPRSRAAAHRGEVKDVPAVGNALDQLAARRAGRRGAPPVDPPAP